MPGVLIDEQGMGGNPQISTPTPNIMSSTPIQPFNQVKTTVIASFRMNITRVELFKSVDVSVQLLAEDGTTADVRHVKIEGDDYAQWTNDDQSLVNMVAAKLGFTLGA